MINNAKNQDYATVRSPEDVSLIKKESQNIVVKPQKQEQLITNPNQKTKRNLIIEKIDKLLSSNQYEIAMSLLTFIVLYADDIRILALTSSDDNIYYYFMIVVFFVYFIEIIVLSIVRDGYVLSFFFYMDIASTFSCIIGVPIVMGGLLGIQALGQQSLKVSKATSNASKVSSQATKVLRVVRLIRLIRIAKLYKYAFAAIEAKLAIMKKIEEELNNDVKNSEYKVQNNKDQLNNDMPKLQEYNSKMIPKPTVTQQQQQKLEKNEQQQQQQQQQQLQQQQLYQSQQQSQLQSQIQLQQQQQCQLVDINIIKIQQQMDIRNSQNENTNKSSIKLQMIEIGERPINYKEHDSLGSIEGFNQIIENVIIDDSKGKEQNQEFMIEETNVGKRLSDLTTRRAISIMFSIMFSIPLLDINTYYTQVSSYNTGIQYLENMQDSFSDFMISSGNNYGGFVNSSIYPSMYLQVNNAILINNKVYQNMREESLEIYTSTSGNSILIVDASDDGQLNAILGLIRTTFVICVMIYGALAFSTDSNNFIVQPIEVMLDKVKRISQDPLVAAQIEEDMAMIEDQFQKSNHNAKEIKQKLIKQSYETTILENLIIKTGALLAIGFGDAGSNIIASNIRSGGEVNPLMQGNKTFAIFGFCDIRNFSDFTEVLEERVMIFVNQVAQIVHSLVNQYEGSTNKNIGDAFLLVWKFPADSLQLNNNHPQISNLRIVNNIADMALVSFIKIFLTVRKSIELKDYCEMPEIQARLPGYRIKMGFGLHIGWAIEGAIGSLFKIDASYLSPNVNMASRLEAATKQYGVFHIVSGPFFRLLSVEAQQRMRHIDRVTVKGSMQPIDFYTFDIDLDAIKGTHQAKDKNRNQKIEKFLSRKKKNEVMQLIKTEQYSVHSIFQTDPEFIAIQEKFTYEFQTIFNDGINSYLQGRWGYAKGCFEYAIDQFGFDDGPCRTLLKYMDQFEFDAPDNWRGYRELIDK